MAFLCPVRIRSRAGGQAKKKKGHSSHGELTDSGLTNSEELGDNEFNSELPVATTGRITGSSSIETLVRVGLEKENGLSPDARMVVLHDFQPCVDDELEVKRGTVVSVLYRENDWVYVLIENSSKEGFIPHSYCAPYGSPLGDMAKKDGLSQDDLSSCNSEVHPFYKDPSGRYMTLYKFVARDENDVNVDRGELITVLNKDDPDWFWVVRSDGQEGFVPSAFVYPLNPNSEANLNAGNKVLEEMENSRLSADECHGTELVMLYDYKAQAPDDLSVRRGDWIYADLQHQTVEGWLWAFDSKQRKYGFIPKAYARPCDIVKSEIPRPPAMTAL